MRETKKIERASEREGGTVEKGEKENEKERKRKSFTEKRRERERGGEGVRASVGQTVCTPGEGEA